MTKVQTSLRLEKAPLIEVKAILGQLKQPEFQTDLRAILEKFPDDFMKDGREQPELLQTREELFKTSRFNDGNE